MTAPIFVPSTQAPTHLGAFREPPGAPSAAAGGAFLPDVLGSASRQIVQIAPGANLTQPDSSWPWVDVTKLVLWDPGVSITAGRSDESTVAQPAQCGLTLRDDSGNFTSFYPGSKYFPFIGPDVPLRCFLDVGAGAVLRFEGYTSGFTPRWDATRNRRVAEVAAFGILQRLNNANQPVRPPLQRAVLATTTASLLQFWALEDGSSATLASSALPSGVPMVVAGTVRFAGFDPLHPTNSSFTLLPGFHFGYGSIPDFKDGGRLAASFSSGQSGLGWTIQFIPFNDFLSNTATATVLSWTTADGASWTYVIDPTGVTGTVNRNGTQIAQVLEQQFSAEVRIEAVVSGSNTNVTLKMRPSGSTGSGSYSGRPGALNAVTIGDGVVRTGQFAVGELRLWDNLGSTSTVPVFQSATSNTVFPYSAYQGESPTTRLARLCAEEGIPITIIGSSGKTMGPQTAQSVIALLRECEAVDGGVLYDGFGPGLTYVAYNKIAAQAATLTINATNGELIAPFAPTQDALGLLSSFTASNTLGTTQTYTAADLAANPASASRNGTALINNNDDKDLINFAAWQVHKGRVWGFRYPQVTMHLEKKPAQAAPWLATALLGRIDIVNLSTLAPFTPDTVRLLLNGYSEMWNSKEWIVVPHCSAYEPWRVGVIDASVQDAAWRIDSGGSALHQGYSVGATSLLVDVFDGFLWSTAAGDYPRLFDVGGVRVNVTAMSGASSPQTATCDALAFALSAAATVKLWRPPTISY